MKNRIRKCLAMTLAVIVAFSCAVTAFAADSEVATVQVKATFDQTGARSMLQMVNDLRTGDEAWYWNPNNTTKKDLTGQLQEMVYDYSLEKIAMQRAVEVAMNFSHTRPNGTNCATAVDEADYDWRMVGENIAAGYPTVEAAFEGWAEADEDYSGQGHRRNMLSNMTAIGIAHVRYNGVDFWVQVLATPWSAADTTPTPANDSEATMDVRVAPSQIRSVSLTPSAESLSLEAGDTVALPAVTANLTLASTWRVRPNVTASPNWTVAPSGVVEINSDGTITAKAVGKATLTGSVLGETVNIPVTVTGTSIAAATVTLDKSSYTYTGQAIKPKVTVALNGTALKEGTDYTLAYKNNTKVGTATVTVNGIGTYTDSISKEFTITACDHQWDNGVVTTPATCAAEGVRTYHCTLCDETKTEPIAKLPHTPVVDPAVAPTCTSTGLTEGSHCSVCGQVIVAQTVVEKIPHNYVESVETPATCTTDGQKKFTCSVCGDSYTEVIPATGHSFGNWKTVTSPTCTETGSEQRVCSVCSYTETRGLEATGHSWAEDYTIDQAPTCTKDGSKSIHCTVCDAVTDAQVIPATGHTQDEGVVITEPTCTEAGKMHYTCTVCGEEWDDVIPATGHTWDEGTIVTPATCTENGSMEHTCLTCGFAENVVIPATGHNYEDTVIPPTCTEDGYTTHTCTVCGYTYTDTPVAALGHKVEVQNAKDATCTEPGYTGDSVCTVCGETVETGEVIPATGHSYGETWESNETSHWHACACGDTIDAADHTFQWVIDKEATATEAGSKHQECTVCGYQGAMEEIPATGEPSDNKPNGGTGNNNGGVTGDASTSGPQTGQNNNLIVPVAILAISCGGLVVVMLYFRKRRA